MHSKTVSPCRFFLTLLHPLAPAAGELEERLGADAEANRRTAQLLTVIFSSQLPWGGGGDTAGRPREGAAERWGRDLCWLYTCMLLLPCGVVPCAA